MDKLAGTLKAAAASDARKSSPGICSSVPRRSSITTRCTTRSTGAAGPTGASARSATWARTYRSRVLVAGTRIPDDDRDAVDAVQQGHLPDGHDDVLRVPGARCEAGGEGDVVRRRPAACQARGTGRRGMDKGGGVIYFGSKGKLIHETYGGSRACSAQPPTRQSRRRSSSACRRRTR